MFVTNHDYSTGSEIPRFDVIALGETMLALSPPPGASLRDATALLVDHAGAESNTCVGLARLGLRVAWISRLGADAAGDRIVSALTNERIDTRWVRRDPQRPTGLMIKEPDVGVRYYRTGSAASALGPEDLTGVPLHEARAVLVSGVTALIGPQPHAAGLALLSAAGHPPPLRIVDPNLRHGLWGSDRRRELVMRFVERSDLLLTGAQELAELLGESNDVRTLAEHAAARGPREIVVRASDSVGALSDKGSWVEIDVRRHTAVDPVGAGDAFNAGYIAVRLNGGTVEDALQSGARCGAAVTTAVSDTAAFPRRLE
jgi:2-dehydro-3-deoxygluconokinase